jgi:hypothetical protein
MADGNDVGSYIDNQLLDGVRQVPANTIRNNMALIDRQLVSIAATPRRLRSRVIKPRPGQPVQAGLGGSHLAHYGDPALQYEAIRSQSRRRIFGESYEAP